MYEDGFLEVIATMVVLAALVVAGALGATGGLADPVTGALCSSLLAWSLGLWGLAARVRRRAAHQRRLQLLAIERLVGALREHRPR